MAIIVLHYLNVTSPSTWKVTYVDSDDASWCHVDTNKVYYGSESFEVELDAYDDTSSTYNYGERRALLQLQTEDNGITYLYDYVNFTIIQEQ
ncbi:MAG: hypothetical protein SNH88_07645 [Rikenellaceae bacterium]